MSDIPMDNDAQAFEELKMMTRAVADSLREQDELLRSRNLKLPPGVIQTLSAVVKDISQLETGAGGDAIELTQLRSLASTGAMINSTLDLDAVLAKAMDNVIDLAGAERGFLILQNQRSGDLEFRISRDTTGKNGGDVTGSDKSPQLSMTIVQEV
ncbi:MAG: hypothetical protein AAF125_15735, partial [Chloroflexota bacterium]